MNCVGVAQHVTILTVKLIIYTYWRFKYTCKLIIISNGMLFFFVLYSQPTGKVEGGKEEYMRKWN